MDELKREPYLMTLLRTYHLPVAIVAAIVLIAFWIGLRAWGAWHDEWSGYNASVSVSDGTCNIAVISIQGDIAPYASEEERYLYTYAIGDEVIAEIDQAEWDPYIDGILVQIDSYGGSASAASEITDRLQRSPLRTAAYVREAAASAAYLVATGAETIIATPFADIGSIGVTMSYLDQTQQNSDSGLEFISLTSGEYKDYGDPNRPLTEEEHSLLERDLEIFHQALVSRIAVNRNLPEEEVAALADGSSMPAQLALEHKLIDTVGSREEVRAWFATQLGMDAEDVVFCE